MTDRFAPAPRLYVSGPITGRPHGNRTAFDTAAQLLRQRGFEVVNPHDLDHAGVIEWAEHMRRDIRALMACHGLALLDGWEHSRGSLLEHHIAQQLGMTCQSVEDWLDANNRLAIAKYRSAARSGAPESPCTN